MANIPNSEPTSAQLRAVISTQTEIAILGLNLKGVMTMIAEQAQVITGSSGAVVELAEGDDMVYRAVAGIASSKRRVRTAHLYQISQQKCAPYITHQTLHHHRPCPNRRDTH